MHVVHVQVMDQKLMRRLVRFAGKNIEFGVVGDQFVNLYRHVFGFAARGRHGEEFAFPLLPGRNLDGQAFQLMVFMCQGLPKMLHRLAVPENSCTEINGGTSVRPCRRTVTPEPASRSCGNRSMWKPSICTSLWKRLLSISSAR